MPVVETNIRYEYADKTTKAKALRKNKDLTWVSTSMQNGVERWKFANVVHSKPNNQKKITYTGDDTKGNRRAWDK